MTAFWFVAALLLGVALLFLLPPLLRRETKDNGVVREAMNVAVHKDQLAELDADLRSGVLSQEQYSQAKADIERDLLQSLERNVSGPAVSRPASARTAAIVIAVVVPVVAIGLYSKVGGGAAALNPPPAQQASDAASQHQGKSVEEMITMLEARLAEHPEEATGWYMLGKSYYFSNQYDKAVGAFAKAAALTSEQDADVLADYADALGVLNNRSLAGKPTELVLKALQANPDHPKALWLAGTAALNSNDLAAAREHWTRLLKLLPPGSENAQIIESSLAEVSRQLGEPAAPVVAVAAAAASITGMADIDPQLARQAAPTDTVFIFARAASGPRAPLAILRKQVKDLPVSFTLDDSMAMNPAMKLSGFPEVVVGARVSKSGTAMPQPGDLEGYSRPIKLAEGQGLRITINRVVQ